MNTLGHLWGILLPHRTEQPWPRRPGDDILDAVLFTSTVKRALAVVPGRRLIVVLDEDADEAFRTQVEGLGATAVIQPHDRGSAPPVAEALRHVTAREERGTVIVLPEGALAAPQSRLTNSLAKAAWGVRREPDLLVMIGARPPGPVSRFPWIQPGAPMGGMTDLSIRTVKRFVASASPDTARDLYGHDALLATQIMVGTAERLLELEPGASTAVAVPWAELFASVPTRDDRLGVLALPDAPPYAERLHHRRREQFERVCAAVA